MNRKKEREDLKMKGSCFELEAFKVAREQAESKVYTPPELSRIEQKVIEERTHLRCRSQLIFANEIQGKKKYLASRK